MRTAEADTDLSKALDTFYAAFPLVKMLHDGDIITYKLYGGEHSNACALDEAEKVIKKYNLPLKAEITHDLVNTLKISAK